MAAPVTRFQPSKLPTLPSSTTPEQRYWRSFVSPLVVNEGHHVTHINFAVSPPYDFAVTAGAAVKLYSSRTRAVTKTISRFKDTAYSAHIRRDGRILVAGEDSGRIQAFDLSSRAILKTWDEHKQPVHVTKFSSRDMTTVLSASDDTTLRLWDLPSNTSVQTFVGNEDYVRSAAFLPGSDVVISGGYDGTVRLYDPRAGDTAGLMLRHPQSVEAILPLPGGTSVLAAAGPQVFVWDIVAAKQMSVLQNHQKTVTCLALAGQGTEKRVLAGGLDRHVKIYETAEWKVVHGVKYPAPVLSVSVGGESENQLVVGMAQGTLSIRTRSKGKAVLTEKERAFDLIAKGLDPQKAGASTKKGKSGNAQRKLKGIEYKGEGIDIIIESHKKSKKESPWERKLRTGKFSNALTEVLLQRDVMQIYSVMKELIYRDALSRALANRDEDGLRLVVEWIGKILKEPRCVDVAVEVACAVLDLYSHALGMGTDFDGLMWRLQEKVNREVEVAMRANGTGGMLQMLLAAEK